MLLQSLTHPQIPLRIPQNKNIYLIFSQIKIENECNCPERPGRLSSGQIAIENSGSGEYCMRQELMECFPEMLYIQEKCFILRKGFT